MNRNPQFMERGPRWRQRLRWAAFLIVLLWIVIEVAGSMVLILRSDVYDMSDSAYYYRQARNILNGEPWYESLVFSHLAIHPQVRHPSFDHWQPLTAVAAAGMGEVVGDDALGSKLALFVAGSVALPALAFAFVYGSGGSRLSGAVAAALCLSWTRMEYYRFVLETVPFAACFLLAGCLCAARGVWRTNGPSSVLLFIAGLSFAMLAWTRGDGLPIGLLLGCWAAVWARPGHRGRSLSTLGAGFAAGYAPLLVKNAVQFGSLVAPGSREIFWVTAFGQYGSFGEPIDPGLLDLVRARARALLTAITTTLGSSVVMVYLASMVSGLVSSVRHRVRQAGSWPFLLSALLMSAGAIGLFHLVGILMAPAVTLWRHRSPVPYLVLLLVTAILSLDYLLRTHLRGRTGLIALVVAAAALLPGISPDPTRHFRRAPNEASPAFANASAMLPEGVAVMTNAPLALYVEHDGVVRIPNNGEAAIAKAIRHYRVGRVVLFGDALQWADDTTSAIYQSNVYGLGGSLRLRLLFSSESYRLYGVDGGAAGQWTNRLPPGEESREEDPD